VTYPQKTEEEKMKSSVAIRFEKHSAWLLALASWLLGTAGASANSPSKPVKLVVTDPPGGSSDLMARIMGQKLSEHWGQPVIIESRPGCAGCIGAWSTPPVNLLMATPFVVGNLGPAAVNPLISKVPYNMEEGFHPRLSHRHRS
jgi:tripartite-type tricarboxylate transporter receptor subunit TctC